MQNTLIKNAALSEFKLPIIVQIAVAYTFFILGEIIGGNGAIACVNQYSILHKFDDHISLIFTLVTPIMILLWVKFIENRSIKGLGLNPKPFAAQSLKGGAFGFIAFSSIVLAAHMLANVSFNSVHLTTNILLSVLLLIPCWFIQAASEEILFRGWLLPTISSKYGKLIGSVLSAIVFTAIHLDNPNMTPLAMLNIFIVGIFFALITLDSQSLWPAISFHALWNFTQSAFWGLAVSGHRPSGPYLFGLDIQGNPLITGGKFGLEGSVLTTILLLAFVVYYLYPSIVKN